MSVYLSAKVSFNSAKTRVEKVEARQALDNVAQPPFECAGAQAIRLMNTGADFCPSRPLGLGAFSFGQKAIAALICGELRIETAADKNAAERLAKRPAF